MKTQHGNKWMVKYLLSDENFILARLRAVTWETLISGKQCKMLCKLKDASKVSRDSLIYSLAIA